MQGVGPGSLLAGRYALRDRLTHHAHWERWSATDTDLGLDVVLLCFPSASPQAEPALDAARRAAAVEDSRLTRLLDVGRDATVCFVVEEATPGATSFTSLVDDGGLPPEGVRRIVAEAAQGLGTARSRGLHHGVLSPRDVLVLPDGSVIVRGLATHAALLGDEDRPADQASRADAVALAGLMYAGLTGRWPLPGLPSGLQAAPRLPSGIVAPSQIASGVPADVNALVMRTLHGDNGPGTPDEVAEALFPGSTRRRGARVAPSASRSTSSKSRTPPASRTSTTGGTRRSARGTSGGGRKGTTGEARSRTGAPPEEPTPATTVKQPPTNAARSRTGAPPEEPTFATPKRPPTNSATGRTGAPAPRPPATAVAKPTRHSDNGGAPNEPPRPAAASAGAAVTSAATVAKTAAERVVGGLGRLGTTASTVAGQVGAVTKTTVERAVERSGAAKARRKRRGDASAENEATQNARLTDVLEETDERLEPPVPRAFVPDPGAVPDRQQARLALAIVAGFVVIAALLGIWGLPSLGGTPSAAPITRTTPTSTEAPTGPSTTTDASTPTAAPPSLAEPSPVAIVRAAGFEPTNGGQVASSTADRAHDADPATTWQSKWFATEDFGGLPIEGIGLIAGLGQASDVRRVRLQLPVKQDATVYVANQASLDGAKQLGTFIGQEGTVVLDAPSGAPLNGELVIVYVTRLGSDGEGRFRAQVSEIEVSG